MENGLKWQECSLADIWPAICKCSEPKPDPKEEIELAERLVSAGLLGKATDGTAQ